MRRLIKIAESITSTLYHGSRNKFRKGFILKPQPDGYILGHDETSHVLTEKVMEDYRPSRAVKRENAVFLVNDPDDIDYAGGYNDFVYEVEPMGTITRCNLKWYSEVFMICEHISFSDDISEERAAHEDKLAEMAIAYWNAEPTGKSDIFEYLCEQAKVKEIIEY